MEKIQDFESPLKNNRESAKKETDVTKSLIAEQSVLGSILIDPEHINEVIEILKPEDFAYAENKYIYEVMDYCYNSDKPIDLIVIQENLTRKGLLDAAGGISYLAALSSAPDFSKNVKEYAKIVKDRALIRKMIDVCNRITQSAYTGEESSSLLEKAENEIFEVSQGGEKSSLVHIKEPLWESFEELEKNYRDKRAVTGLHTGFNDLNLKTKGLQKSDMVVLAARPGTGKTAFALNLALAAAMQDKASVAIFSLEMSRVQLVQRMLAADSMVELSKIKDGNLEADDFRKISRTINVISSLKINIDDTPGISMAQIRSRCRKLKMRQGLDLVIIDFLQLVEPFNSNEPRQVQVSGISRAIKILAKEMNCTVLALSQINRESEKSKDRRPMLSDLRESGAIEQDADLVMFLYRDDMYNPDTEKPGVTEVILAKHRNGETGTIDLSWQGKFQKFFGLERGF